jgi:hypothetical protein
VVVTRLSDEELEELKRDPSRYKSPERKVPRIRPRSPSVETIFENNVEESNPIVIDLEDDEPISLPPSKSVFDRSALTTMATITSITKKNHVRKCNTAKRSKPLKPIIFVDLCSSDDEVVEDEDDSSLCISTDENRDPMQRSKTTSTMEVCVDPNFLCNSLLAPSKLCNKPCIYPADSTNNWFTTLNIDDQPRSFLKHVSIFKVTP